MFTKRCRLGLLILAMASGAVGWGAMLPEPLVKFDFADDDMTNSGTLTLSSTLTVASGFTFVNAEDTNGTTRRALKSTGSAVTNVDLAAENITVSGHSISFWATSGLTGSNWVDVAGIDYLFDPSSTTRTWQAFERKSATEMAIYSGDNSAVEGPTALTVNPSDKLHHWVVVGEGNTLTYYLDGMSHGTYTYSALREGSLFAAFGFGGSAKRNAQRAQASVADMRLYDVALSPMQAAYLASGESASACFASVGKETKALSALTWEEGGAYVSGTTKKMCLVLADGATLQVDSTLAVETLMLQGPAKGFATVQMVEGGAFAKTMKVQVSGQVDFGATSVPTLEIANRGVATVQARNQITTLSQHGTGVLRLAGGAALTALDVDATVGAGKMVAVAKTVTTGTLPISGRTLNIEEDANITVSTMFRTAHGNQSGDSKVNHTGGTLTCSGGANNATYKEGAFVLSHWDRTTNYSLSGGTLNVTQSAAKLGADGTGNLTISGTGVANLHSVSIKKGTLKLAGGTLNLGASSVSSATSVVGRDGGSLELAGGTLGTWTRANLSIGGAVTLSADTTIRTASAEAVPQKATIAFTGTLSGAGGLLVEGGGELDLSSATYNATGSLAVGDETTLVLGTKRLTLKSVAETAKVKLTVTDQEMLEGSFFLPTAGEVPLTAAQVIATRENGEALTLSEGASPAEGGLSFPLPVVPKATTSGNWSTPSLWSTGREPTTGDVAILGGDTAETAITLTLDTALSAEITSISVSGHVRLVVSPAQPSLPAPLILAENTTLTLEPGTEVEASLCQLRKLTLEGNAVLDIKGSGFTANGQGETALELNGNTLTKRGEGTLGLSNATVTAGALVVAEGKVQTSSGGATAFTGPITFESDLDDAFDFSAGTVSLSGALTKKGSGALTFPGVISGNGALNVEGGSLTLTALCTRGAGAITTIASGATLDISAATARLYANTFGGAENTPTVTVQGHLITRDWAYSTEGAAVGKALGCLRTNNYAVKVDGGTITFVDTDESGVIGVRGFQVTANGGTLVLPEGLALIAEASTSAYLSVASGGTLTVRGGGALSLLQTQALAGQVHVEEATTLAGSATITGTLTLDAGAKLDASEHVLTVGAVALPDEERQVLVKASADREGTEVLKLSTAVDPATFSAAACKVEDSIFSVAPTSDGRALALAYVARLPEGVGSDDGALSPSAATILKETAETLGVADISAITGKTAQDTALSAEQLSAALDCFAGNGLVKTGETTAEGTALMVTYNFGITGLTYDPESKTFTVTARVEGASISDTVGFAESVQVELYDPATPDQPALATATTTPGASEVQLTLSGLALEASHAFKVRAVK